jgi:hypothetical protein
MTMQGMLIAPRRDDPTAADAAPVDPPVLAAIRCVFGVGA